MPEIVDRRSSAEDTSPSNPSFWTQNTYTVAAICGFLLLVVALVFGQTVGHKFVNYDDPQYVYENPQVAQGLTARGIVWAFTTVNFNNWHPLTSLSHMLDFHLYGLQPGGHHLTNVLLHAAVAILLFLVLRRMTGTLWPSAFAATVFAIHPLRAESVAWVAERKDLLSGLFFMLTLWAYVGYSRHSFSTVRYLKVLVLFALGLMAKPMLVTLPFVLLLLDYWPLGRLGLPAAGISRRVVVEKLPLLALATASSVVTFFAQGKAVIPVDAFTISSRIANALVSYVAYIGELFYPIGLAVLYPYPESGLPIWKVAASALALAGISTAAVVWRRRFPYLFVGWFWYMGMLVPVIGLVQVGMQSMADRYTYLPQIGLCIAVTWGVAQLAASWRNRFWVYCAASALVVLVLMGLAWRQVSYWRDSETLWTNTLACTARNFIAHSGLGTALAEQGQVDVAIAHYRKALEIKPDYAEAHQKLGIALAGQGQFDEAIVHFQKAVALWPDFAADAHQNLGIALAGRGRFDAAIVHYRKVLELKPDLASAHNNLGLALGFGQVDEAIAHFQKAVELKPDYADAHQNLGVALAGRGQYDAAIAHYRKALELKVALPDITHNNLGIALARRGQFDAAIVHFRKALELNPGYADARNNLDLALRMREQPD